MLSYQALAEEVTPDSILERVQAVVPVPQLDLAGDQRGVSALHVARPRTHAGASRAGPDPGPLLSALDVAIGRRVEGLLAGDYRSSMLGPGTELALIRPYVPGDDVRLIDWAVTARTGEPHVRVQLAERVLVTWLVLDTSPSMSFGTADRTKADLAEGVAIALGHLSTRRGNRLGVLTFGGADERWLPPRAGASRPARPAGDASRREGDAPEAASARPRSAPRPTVRPRSHGSARSSWSSPTSAARGTGRRRCSSSPAGTR